MDLMFFNNIKNTIDLLGEIVVITTTPHLRTPIWYEGWISIGAHT